MNHASAIEAARCAACANAEDCKRAFGKYWNAKSGGGVGCGHPFAYQREKDVEASPFKAGNAIQEVML